MVRYPSPLLDDPDAKLDLLPRLEDIKDKELTIRDWVVKLDIQTDPFSEVIIPGTNTCIGCVNEWNFRQNNTLPSGRYRYLLVTSVKEGVLRNGLNSQRICLVALKGARQCVERQTIITMGRLTPEGKVFMVFGPQLE